MFGFLVLRMLWPFDIIMHVTKPYTSKLDSKLVRVPTMTHFSFQCEAWFCVCVCVCVCVYTVTRDTQPQHISPSMLLKLAARSCRRGMRPGREPHRNNNSPHQRSSIDGTWLSTFILWVYESSLHPSITHWHGEGREKRRWFAKDKLTTNWSLTHVFHLFFLLLLTFFLFMFNSISSKLHSGDAYTSTQRQPAELFHHLSIHQILQVPKKYVLCLSRCSINVPLCQCLFGISLSEVYYCFRIPGSNVSN